MSTDTTISSKALSACAKAASTQAVKTAKANNVDYTVQEGRKIVRHSSDGTKEIIGTLEKAYIKPAIKHYSMA